MAEGEQNNDGFKSTVIKYAKRVWAYLKAAKMEYIVMISLFALDLISKAIVNATTAHGDVVVLIPNFLNIHNSHNYAAAFGNGWISELLGNMGARIFFSIFAVASSVVFIIILIKNKGGNKVFRVALAMLTAGAMGNCIDRMFLGYVRDFVEFVYFGLTIAGSKSFYIFNIADAELVIGVILMIVYFLFMYRDKDDKKHAVAKNKAADGESAEITSDEQTNTEKADGGEIDGAAEADEPSAEIDDVEMHESTTEETADGESRTDGAQSDTGAAQVSTAETTDTETRGAGDEKSGAE